MHVASQGPRTWKADDILIFGGATVQVKTTDKGTKAGWLVGAIDVLPLRFYAFVDYSDALQPVVYVIPSRTAEDAAATADRRYYEQRPNSKPWGGRVLSDPWGHDVPEFPPGWLDAYKEAWHLIPAREI
jgi:hypothetical protein